MTGTAQLMEVRVQSEGHPDDGPRQLYRLTPPIEGDDGVMYEFGAAMQTYNIADVFAATMSGEVVTVEESGYTTYVSLINAPLLERRQWTIPDLFARYGYEVTR